MNFNRLTDLSFHFRFFVGLTAVLLALYGMAIGTPGTAFAAVPAQEQQGHEFSGAAFIDGQPAPQGTVVAALDSGTQIASVSVDASGKYSNLQIPTAGIFVTFTLDGLAAAETATTQAGGATILDLNANRPQAAPPTNTPAPQYRANQHAGAPIPRQLWTPIDRWWRWASH